MVLMSNKPIKIRNFAGMNNIVSDGGLTSHEDGSFTANPRVILNSDVTPEGRLRKRGGITAFIPLPNPYSLWSNRRVMLCASEGYLYRVFPDRSYLKICSIIGTMDDKLYYTTVEDKIYISSRRWTGIFDPMSNNISSWGIELPVMPELIPSTGSLPPGTYHVCYTRVVNGQISGNGPVASLVVNQGGIKLFNRPADCIAWVTEADEYIFYPASSDEISSIDNSEPLTTFGCYPPNPMRFIRLAFGRLWGVVDEGVVYSEEFRYDLFKETNIFRFVDEAKMLAFTAGGFYVGFENQTLFYAGDSPSKMREIYVGNGVSKDTVAYCNNIPKLGNGVPVWMGVDGVMAGSPDGQLINVTKDVVSIMAGKDGAAIARSVNGSLQYMATFMQQERPKGSSMGIGDSATCEVIRQGAVIQ